MKSRLLLFFILLSLLLISIWQHLFHLPPSIILYHMIVMAPLHIFIIIAISLVYRLLLPYRWYLVVSLGSWVLMVSFFYLFIFGSMYFWGDIITAKILAAYLANFLSFLHSLPFSYTEIWIIIIGLIGSPYLLVYLFAGSIGRALPGIAGPISAHRKALIVLPLILLFSFPLLIRAKRVIHKAGEPLLVMLLDHMWIVTDNPFYSQRRARAGLADGQLRKKYANTEKAPSKKNVILIIVDALRADHLSAYGYRRVTSPFIGSLIDSGRAVKVDRCFSTCACTTCGVASILLSRTWNDCSYQGFNIIALLHDHGYSTYAFLSGSHRNWYNMPKLYSDDCTVYDGRDAKKYYFNDDRVLLEGLKDVHLYQDTPAFFYFHLLSTHPLGLLQDKYDVYRPCKKSIGVPDINDEALVNEYDNKVIQADDIIKQIFSALADKGYLKNSLVMITSDHGQGLGEHGKYGHVYWLYQEEVSIPLIIYDSDTSLYRNHTLARQIDIAPTILDRLGLAKPNTWMGESLLQNFIAPYSYHETGLDKKTSADKYMILWYDTLSRTAKYQSGIGGPSESGRHASIYKYIFTKGFKDEELYDVASDPAEKYNLSSIQKETLVNLRSKAKSEMNSKFSKD